MHHSPQLKGLFFLLFPPYFLTHSSSVVLSPKQTALGVISYGLGCCCLGGLRLGCFKGCAGKMFNKWLPGKKIKGSGLCHLQRSVVGAKPPTSHGQFQGQKDQKVLCRVDAHKHVSCCPHAVVALRAAPQCWAHSRSSGIAYSGAAHCEMELGMGGQREAVLRATPLAFVVSALGTGPFSLSSPSPICGQVIFLERILSCVTF
jgi:hypothetical protein